MLVLDAQPVQRVLGRDRIAVIGRVRAAMLLEYPAPTAIRAVLAVLAIGGGAESDSVSVVISVRRCVGGLAERRTAIAGERGGLNVAVAAVDDAHDAFLSSQQVRGSREQAGQSDGRQRCDLSPGHRGIP